MWADDTDPAPSDGPTLWALVALAGGAARIEEVLRIYASIPSARAVLPSIDDPQVLALLGALRLCELIRKRFAGVEPRGDTPPPSDTVLTALRSVLR